jgi:hypothetical protein
MAAFHNRFFIPDASEFFNALLDLLRQSGEDGLSGDTAEFFSRRLEEYQRTLGVMYSRLRECRPSSTEQLGEDMGQLINVFGWRIETLNRRRQEIGMAVGHEHNFSPLTDNELDILVRGILSITPQSGVGLVQGALRSRGLRIQRRRVLESLRRLDPITSALRQSRRIIRRTYRVPGPNSLW